MLIVIPLLSYSPSDIAYEYGTRVVHKMGVMHYLDNSTDNYVCILIIVVESFMKYGIIVTLILYVYMYVYIGWVVFSHFHYQEPE
jgi:hypothetical protein